MATKAHAWIGRYDATPTDFNRETWAWVPSGSSLLTRRAAACEGIDRMWTDKYGTSKLGRWVRHADLADRLDEGGPAAVRKAALAVCHMNYAADRAGIALASSPRLLAAITAVCALSGDAITQGGEWAIATGSPRRRTTRRAAVLIALGAQGRVRITAEQVAGWDATRKGTAAALAAAAVAGLQTTSDATPAIVAA